jgi:type IV pilus assembly protein PilE
MVLAMRPCALALAFAVQHPRRAARGFSLIEICVVLAIVGIVATLAWPSHQAELQRARRFDALSALTRMQFAQEQYRARFGVYSTNLAALTGAASGRSAEGLYLLALADATGDRVTLAARARADGPQQADAECREITIQLNQGLADLGPSGRCWNR